MSSATHSPTHKAFLTHCVFLSSLCWTGSYFYAPCHLHPLSGKSPSPHTMWLRASCQTGHTPAWPTQASPRTDAKGRCVTQSRERPEPLLGVLMHIMQLGSKRGWHPPRAPGCHLAWPPGESSSLQEVSECQGERTSREQERARWRNPRQHWGSGLTSENPASGCLH